MKDARPLLLAALAALGLVAASAGNAQTFARVNTAAISQTLPSAAGAASAPVLVQGLLASVAGGTVSVSLEPTGMKAGDPARQSTTIATAALDDSGQFTLQADPSANGALASALAQARRDNGGWLNFDLVAVGNGQMVYESVARQFVNGTWHGQGDSSAIAVAAPAVRTSAPTKSFTAIPACVWYTSVSSDGDTNTTIGELHTGDNQTAWFRYGQSADSSVEVGIQNPVGSSWSVSGSVHVGDSQASYIQWNEGAQWGYKVRTNMHYQKIYHYSLPTGCGGNPYYTVKATGWNSGQALGDNVHDLDNNCRNSPYVQGYAPNGDFQTTTETATWFTAAASAFGATLRAQSGFSSYVISHWHHGNAYPTYYHCGSDAMPNQAHRIYSGW